MPGRPVVLLVLAVTTIAGCGDKPAATATADEGAAEPVLLAGIVVTEAIVPIAGASVVVQPGGLNATTDLGGVFRVGPLEPGLYEVTATADGYAATTVPGLVVEEGVATGGDAGEPALALRIVMPAIRDDVPYIQLQKFDGYLMCTVDTWVAPYQIIGAPCFGVIDIVTGQQVSQDQWQFEFAIDAPGLAGILAEMFWDEQPAGRHMGMLLRNVAGAGSGVDAGGTNVDVQYASTRGPAPLPLRVLQGIENPGSDEGAAFQVPQNDTMSYKLLILGRADYGQPADVHLMLNNRPEVYVTEFYHAMGDESYSVADV